MLLTEIDHVAIAVREPSADDLQHLRGRQVIERVHGRLAHHPGARGAEPGPAQPGLDPRGGRRDGPTHSRADRWRCRGPLAH